MQLPLLIPESNWRPPRISDLPNWEGRKRIAIDIETHDPKLRELGPGVRRGAYIVGVSFAIEDSNHKYYLPLRHSEDNMEESARTLGWLREQAANFSGEIVGANLSYDLDFLWAAGIVFPKVRAYKDVQILEALIDDLALSYSLETICNKYLNIGKDESLLREAAQAYGVDAKKNMATLPARFVGPYAEADAALPLLVLRRQEAEAEKQELFKIYDTESALLPVLVRMRQRGVRIDERKLEEVEQWSCAEERKALAEIKHETGIEIPFNSVWKADALVRALQTIGCKIPLTPKTKKPSIDKKFLETLDHPVAKAIQRARKVNKVRTTFVQSIRDHMTNGRIHATYHQTRSSNEGDEDGEGTGARYGRCSCTNPNLQQQPARDPEIGPFWRAIYIPEEGELWCSADFSSQEPRQAVHYAVSSRLGKVKVHTPEGFVLVDADKSAREMADRYCNDINTDPHQALADIIVGHKATKEERSMAKIIFLGLSYGMGGAKLCRSLGYPTMKAVRNPDTGATISLETEKGAQLKAGGARVFEAAGPEGQALLDKFDASVPFVRALSRICVKSATKNGYIRTQAGRKCRFPRDEYGNVDWSHKALNRLIQGSAADQTKISLIALDKEGIFLTGQVHDEVLASIKNIAEGKQIVKIMEEAYKLKVPNKIDLEIGSSWGDSSK